jgi:hydroxyethylthiazole kinase-like uncharacterized protein yjeF
MIVTPAEMRAIEEATFASGVAAESLMDEVGRRVASHCLDFIGASPATVLVYAGKGNNAGDALVTARELREQRAARGSPSLQVLIRLAGAAADLGGLPGRKLAALTADDFPRFDGLSMLGRMPTQARLVIIDGLLGIGARGPLREPLLAAAREINHLRQTAAAWVMAIDTPSGLETETGDAAADTVVADETLTVGFAKTGLLEDKAADYTGRLTLIALPEFNPFVSHAPAAPGRGALVTPESLADLLPPRPHESNKGMYGRHSGWFGRRDRCGGHVLSRLRPSRRGSDYASDG